MGAEKRVERREEGKAETHMDVGPAYPKPRAVMTWARGWTRGRSGCDSSSVGSIGAQS